MRIINAHVHAIDLQGMAKRFPAARVQAGIASLSHLEKTLPLLDPKVILEQMDAAEIDRSVLYAVDAPIVYSANEYVAELCAQHPDRFVGFASVDPKRPDALEVLQRALDHQGMRGMKFHPPLQDFSPDDERVFPIYELASRRGVPVVFHVGSTPFGSACKLKHANPLLLDEVAVAFPQMRIMLTHLGTLWHNESFMVVEKNPNVFIDTAAYLHEIEQLLTLDLVTRIGEDKIIFGTDFPMPSTPELPHDMRAFVATIKSLALPDEVKAKIFASNFERMLAPPVEVVATGVGIEDIVAKGGQQGGAHVA